MENRKKFQNLEFKDSFMFATMMEDPETCRFYQGQIDVSYMKPGTDFRILPESFVIFICCFDPCGRKRYQYTFRERCDEDGEQLGDGTCKIFLNTKGENPEDVPPELVRFLKYVDSPETYRHEESDELIQRLQEQILEIKRNRAVEERYMQFQEMLREEREAGKEEGKIEGRIEGKIEGRIEGQNTMALLINALINDKRDPEIIRVVNDLEYRKELLAYYGLIENI